jgi:hypothetical protein
LHLLLIMRSHALLGTLKCPPTRSFITVSGAFHCQTKLPDCFVHLNLERFVKDRADNSFMPCQHSNHLLTDSTEPILLKCESLNLLRSGKGGGPSASVDTSQRDGDPSDVYHMSPTRYESTEQARITHIPHIPSSSPISGSLTNYR